jgi:hypothetical protein
MLGDRPSLSTGAAGASGPEELTGRPWPGAQRPSRPCTAACRTLGGSPGFLCWGQLSENSDGMALTAGISTQANQEQDALIDYQNP